MSSVYKCKCKPVVVASTCKLSIRLAHNKLHFLPSSSHLCLPGVVVYDSTYRLYYITKLMSWFSILAYVIFFPFLRYAPNNFAFPSFCPPGASAVAPYGVSDEVYHATMYNQLWIGIMELVPLPSICPVSSPSSISCTCCASSFFSSADWVRVCIVFDQSHATYQPAATALHSLPFHSFTHSLQVRLQLPLALLCLFG